MTRGIVGLIAVFVATLFLCRAADSSEIYKVVDKDGNVVYTDQPPRDGSEPVDLPPLSVIGTENSATAEPDRKENRSDEAEETPRALNPSELRRLYRDFRITQPHHEETFWGTANAVFVNWGSSEPPAADMSVRFLVDGRAQAAPTGGGLELSLERGEHQVYAELLDARNRVIVTSETVTFFVKQHSAPMRVPRTTPERGY